MPIKIYDLGLVEFKKGLIFQKEIFSAVKRQDFPLALILCQHYPVITLGRTADRGNILINEAQLNQGGVAIYEIERGGDVTYHGPGQITAYPIFDLHYLKKDINFFLRSLEQVVIDLLWDLGIKGTRVTSLTGVWVGRQKIASIGVAIRNWITFHGLSLNVKKYDLANFSFIRPCGMEIEMTSLESLLNRNIDINDIKQALIHKFRDTHVVIGRVSLA
jgi:lipoyl(octanoyl) transferase